MSDTASRIAPAVAAGLVILALSCASDATTIYSSRTAFLAELSISLTDDYQNPAYEQPDNANGTFTDARMSVIRGETRYRTTGLPDHNFVEHQAGQGIYCAGCNGSFELDFTQTSMGSQNGVQAVGLDIAANQSAYPYVAHVTYGDNSTENLTLPVKNAQTPPLTTFWGIISSKRIKSVHFGAYDGLAVTVGGYAIDNLTIGVLTDSDADGVPDIEDNCTEAPNGPLIPDGGGASQRDADGDGYGNLCDGDLNNSGLTTAHDYSIWRSVINQLAGSSATAAAADLNGSGRVTVIDYIRLRAMLNLPPGPSGLHP